MPLLYEIGGDERFDAVVVVTAPTRLREARRERRAGDREPRLIPDEEKVRRADFAYVNDGTLEELDAFVAPVLARALTGVKRLHGGARARRCVVAVLLAGFGRPLRASPPGTQRSRYPLHYQAIVRGHARNYRLDPALLAAVIYTESKFDADAQLVLGRDRPDAAPARDREGIAVRTGGSNFRVSDLYEPRDQRPLRRVVPPPPARQVRRRAAALAAYNAGQDNVDRWRAGGWDPVRRDPRATSTRSRT